MAPADVTEVLVVRVLGVVDEHVHTLGEPEAGDPVARQEVELDADSGLVVRKVGEGGAVRLDPVAERCPRM